MRAEPFDLDGLSPLVRAIVRAALNARVFRELHDGLRLDDHRFERAVLEALRISVDVRASDLQALPATGPAIIVANHPHGALDGLVMAEIAKRVRGDVRVLANRILSRVPPLRELCFFVDPFGGPDAAAHSRAGLRAAHLWLRRGGALVAFPSGEVAPRCVAGEPVDSAWQPTVMRLAQTTGAVVVRAHIEGRNSTLFYAAGRIHPRLRTLLLGRELLKQRGRTVAVRIGATRTVAEEIDALPPRAHLVSSGSFDVFVAEAAAIPATLQEIGRLREATFRAIGEGTGRAVDVDTFDQQYLHVVLWDRVQRQVAGAYRIGRTDRLVAQHGVDGLYTRTLFRYDERFFARIGRPALELGRSFVRSEYQKHHSALLLLWRGIGEFIMRHPQYRYLLGPVSISARYRHVTHDLLIAFLRTHCFDSSLSPLVAARTPPPVRDVPLPVPGSVEELDRLVAAAEPDGKGVPVLLRQYLKLNARVIGFNIDSAFGYALDALMIVDLLQLPPSMLARCLGREGSQAFVAAHGDAVASQAA